MSVNVYVSAVRDPVESLDKMIALKNSCDELEASYPPQLVKYFEGTDALRGLTDDGIRKEMHEANIPYDVKIEGLAEGAIEIGDGMLIDLSKLPAEFKKIRIFMS